MTRSLHLCTALVSVLVLSTPALAAGPLLSPEELHGMLGDGDLVVIDVRSGIELPGDVKTTPANRDFAQGHIPGSVHADYRTAGWRSTQGLIKAMLPAPEAAQALIRSLGVNSDDQVVIVGGGASPKALDIGATTRVYWTFKALGHDAVAILDGGYDGWVAAGYDVSTEAVTPEEGDFTAALRTDMLVNGPMVELAQGNDLELIDGRPASHFTARVQSGYARNPGTIATSLSVPAPGVLAEGGAGFADAETLKARFAAAGFEEGERGYVFCNTGHHATVTWFAASELLGYDVEVYDGSMYDWTFVRNGPTVIGELPDNGG